jgi:hypothetical protein
MKMTTTLAPKVDLEKLTPQQIRTYVAALKYKEKYEQIQFYFQEEDVVKPDGEYIYSRHGFPKHLEFLAKGAEFDVRIFIGGNRIIKTTTVHCELVWHLTGNYPTWFTGKRFEGPQDWWVCGKTKEKLAEIHQIGLLGKDVKDFGTGLIPRDYLDLNTMTAADKQSTRITKFRVRHKNGGWSNVEFKSYDAGAGAFVGTKRNILIDEECPLEVFTECSMRTAGGCIMMVSLTPIDGLTPLISLLTNEKFVTGPVDESKWLTIAGWNDVPHLTEKWKANQKKILPEWEWKARSEGIPVIGSGRVYNLQEELIFINPQDPNDQFHDQLKYGIPDHWARAFSLDFGFDDPTAILWWAQDPDTGTYFCYHESYLPSTEPAVHASVIKTMNEQAGYVIPGVCDPSAGGGSKMRDGKNMREYYHTQYDIEMEPSKNDLFSGITQVVDLMNQGKIKIFSTCVETKREYRNYRVEDGKLRGDDHAMDCLRYFVLSGRFITKSKLEFLQESMPQGKYVYSKPSARGLANMFPSSWR